jgi:hypothetical protein
MDEDDFSLEKLRVDPALMQQVLAEQQARKSKQKEWQRHWTLIPRAWELRLLQAKRISTYRLAIELLYLHWYDGGKPIAVTGKVAKAAKLSASSKSNALAELAQLRLIEMDRGPRRSPRVTLLHTRGQGKSAHDRAI